MLKNKTLLVVDIGDNTYTFECKPDASLGEVHDALCQMKAFVIQKMVENQKADESAVKKEEEAV